MRCQLNALEILTKDKLKITIEPDAGEMIRKIFFLFLKMEPLAYITLQEALSPQSTLKK